MFHNNFCSLENSSSLPALFRVPPILPALILPIFSSVLEGGLKALRQHCKEGKLMAKSTATTEDKIGVFSSVDITLTNTNLIHLCKYFQRKIYTQLVLIMNSMNIPIRDSSRFP